MTVAALCACYIWHITERELQEERSNHRVIRERESIASRMLFAYCRKLLLDTDGKYIGKDEVISAMAAILDIQGYDPKRDVPTKEESPDTSGNAGGR